MQLADGEPLDIVTLQASHLPALCEIVALNDPTLPEMMKIDVMSWLSNPKKGEGYLTAMTDGRPVGMTGYKPDAWGVPDIGWLVWLYIDPKYKRRGIASRLFEAAQSLMKQAGVRKAYLDVGNADRQRDAIGFHEQDGFVCEGVLKDYWASGEDFLVYGKNL